MKSLPLAVALLTISAAVPANAQTEYTMTSQQIADKFALDEFKVKTLEQLMNSVDPQKVKETLLEHMNDKT